MTTICITKSTTGSYQSITCMGHAGYDKKGKDIVCASITILVINTLNALEKLCGTQKDEAVNEKTGFIHSVFKNPLSKEETLLIDTMIMGLETISKNYGKKYCELRFEEV